MSPCLSGGAGSRAHDEEHLPGEEKTSLGSAAPAGIPERGTYRNKGFEARWKKGLGFTRYYSSLSHIFTACSRFPWWGLVLLSALFTAMEPGSPQMLLSLIVILPQVKQDLIHLPLAQQQPQAVPSLGFLWPSAPHGSPQLGTQVVTP